MQPQFEKRLPHYWPQTPVTRLSMVEKADYRQKIKTLLQKKNKSVVDPISWINSTFYYLSG